MGIDEYKEYISTENKITIHIEDLNDFAKFESEFYSKNPMILDENKIYWKWMGNFWQQIDDIDVIIEFNKQYSLFPNPSAKFMSSTRTTLINAIREHSRIFSRRINPMNPNWIVFNDKIYDVISDKIIENDYTYFSTNPIPRNLSDQKNIDTPTIDKMFDEWVGPIWKDTLYEILAYCMLPSYPIQRIFCLHGDGSNGKSTFIELLYRFIGKYNCVSSNLVTLTPSISRFETAKLYKKLVCLMGEIDDNEFKETSLLKSLVSGKEPIAGEYKNKPPFDFINYAKIIISTNKLPSTQDQSSGFYRRWIIIDFPNTFSDSNGDVLQKIPIEEYDNLANKCLLILKKLLLTQKFTNDDEIENRKKRYEERANPINTFFDTYCVEDPYGYIPTFELYEEYKDYLSKKGYRLPSKNIISKMLKSRGIESEVKRIDDKTWRVYIGISWKQKDNNFITHLKKVFPNIINDIDFTKEYSLVDLVDIFKDYDENSFQSKLQILKKNGLIYQIKDKIYMFQKTVNSYYEEDI